MDDRKMKIKEKSACSISSRESCDVVEKYKIEEIDKQFFN
jgi:hypothetical protein